MYSSQPHRTKFRENMSWGYEIRYGPNNMEETVDRKIGSKKMSFCEPVGTIGNVFIPYEIRSSSGQSRRLIVSVWISSPVNAELSSKLKLRMEHLHKAAKRLAKLKTHIFFKERRNGKTWKKTEVVAGKRETEERNPEEGPTQIIDW